MNLKDNQKKVSIIIPMYNSEKYIGKCIKSILNNSYSNYEIIIVDDGSTDSSYSTARSFQDKRISLIKQENKGVSYARNKGLAIANGDYIMFIDSDDYIDENYIQVLVSQIGDDDIGISGIQYIDEHDNLLFRRNGEDNYWFKYKLPITGGKIFKTSFLKKNNLQYPYFSIGEDVLFIIKGFSKTCKVKNIQYVGYNYFRHSDSATQQIKEKIDVLKLLKEIEGWLRESPILDRKDVLFFYKKMLVHNIFLNRKVCSVKEQNEMLCEGVKFIQNIGGKIFQVQKYENLFVNLSINILFISRKIGLSKGAILLMNLMSYEQ